MATSHISSQVSVVIERKAITNTHSISDSSLSNEAQILKGGSNAIFQIMFIYLRLYTNFRFVSSTWSRITPPLYGAHTRCKAGCFEILILERQPGSEAWENKWKRLCLICLWSDLAGWDCYERYQDSREGGEGKVDAEMRIKNGYWDESQRWILE